MSLNLIRTFSQVSVFSRKVSDLSYKLYPGGPPGLSSFNGKVITVFGAYGYLGHSLMALLGKSGAQIIVPHTPDKTKAAYNMKINGDLGQIYPIVFDYTDTASIKKCIKFSDIVINLIGENIFGSSAQVSNVEVPARIAKAVSESSNVSSFIHISSLMSNVLSKDPLIITKKYGENLVKKFCPEVNVIRPAMFYGYGDRYFTYFSKSYGPNQHFSRFFSTYTVKRPIWVGNVAEAIVKVAYKQGVKGKTIELYLDEEYYMGALIRYLEHYMYKVPILLSLSPFFIPRIFISKLTYPFQRYLCSQLSASIFTHEVPSDDPSVWTFEDLGIVPLDLRTGLDHSLRNAKDKQLFPPEMEIFGEYEMEYLVCPTKKDIDDNKTYIPRYFLGHFKH